MTAKKPAKPKTAKKPPANGQAAPKPKRARRLSARAEPSTVLPDGGIVSGRPDLDPEPDPVSIAARSIGTRLGDIRVEPIIWLIEPWVARGTLTCVAGDPDCGKSTFGAWLCSKASRPVILPGKEDPVGGRLAPRLLAAGVSRDRCVVLTDREYNLPDDEQPLTEALRLLHADLLWIDPIDSYVSEDAKSGGDNVRRVLESLAAVAAITKSAVVYVRHPGKQAGNWCPGVRHWRAVPRTILLMVAHGDPPTGHTIRAWRDLTGKGRDPRRYYLDAEPERPPVFRLGGLVDPRERIVMDVTDPLDRFGIEEAEDLLRSITKDGEVECKLVKASAAEQGIGERTLQRAAKRIGSAIRRCGSGSKHHAYYQKPVTPDTRQREGHPPPDATPDADRGGVSPSLSGVGSDGRAPVQTSEED